MLYQTTSYKDFSWDIVAIQECIFIWFKRCIAHVSYIPQIPMDHPVHIRTEGKE